MWTAPLLFVLKDGSYAIRGCEPCQVGNGAALSGLSGVPRGRLFGAGMAVNVCKDSFEFEVYGSFQCTEFFFSAYADDTREVYRLRFSFYFFGGFVCRITVRCTANGDLSILMTYQVRMPLRIYLNMK